MSADDRYRGEDGGLYNNGSNVPLESHLQAALAEAEKIQPLDAEGRPDPGGKIVLITNGMSNTTQESSAFIQAAWIKHARRSPASFGEFPGHAEEMKQHFAVVLTKLKERLPHLRLAYLSSRIYARYAGTHPSPSGRAKVAAQLLEFFKTDPTARLWFAGRL